MFITFILLQFLSFQVFGELLKGEKNARRKAALQANKFIGRYNGVLQPDAKFDDFKPIHALGRGTYGVVQLVEHKRDGKFFAMKSIDLKKNGQKEFETEVSALRGVKSPFIVPLIYSFWDDNWIYGHLVFKLISGGDFLDFLNCRMDEVMSEDEIRFYVANMVMSIQYLQNIRMVHRDLKPANFLFGDDGYLLLADFGLSTPLNRACKLRECCGTMNYIAPEMIIAAIDPKSTDGYTQAVDWWAVGVMTLEMFTGVSPFWGENSDDLFDNILDQDVYIPKRLSPEAQDFVRGLLNRDPEKRLGSKSGREVKEHAFFENINWQDLNKKKVKSPYLPVIGGKDPNNRYRKNNIK